MMASAADQLCGSKDMGNMVTALLLIIPSLMNAAGTLQQLVLGQGLELTEGFAFLGSRQPGRAGQLGWCSSAFTSAGLLHGACRQAVSEFALRQSKDAREKQKRGKKT